jgi:hypothetical protein
MDNKTFSNTGLRRSWCHNKKKLLKVFEPGMPKFWAENYGLVIQNIAHCDKRSGIIIQLQ